ncbi:MAG: hypothetical protein GY927_17135 [bacterium]|nr:hypothetical protein [bacterium]
MEENKLVIIPRDEDVEQGTLELLDDMDLQSVRKLEFFSKVKKHADDYYLMPEENSFSDFEEGLFADSRFIQLSAEILPWLASDKGWRIEIADDYSYCDQN